MQIMNADLPVTDLLAEMQWAFLQVGYDAILNRGPYEKFKKALNKHTTILTKRVGTLGARGSLSLPNKSLQIQLSKCRFRVL